MADLGAAHQIQEFGRRRQGTGLDATVHFAGETKAVDGSTPDKAQEYDRALRHSQYLAASRRRGIGGSVMGVSGLGAGSSASSVFGGLSTARTAVLGDSQGSINVDNTRCAPVTQPGIPPEDPELDGVGSGLGESYVDGGKRSRLFDDGEEEGEGGMWHDGGVLGLLAEIYGRKEAGAGVI